jgi:hypothetical protein
MSLASRPALRLLIAHDDERFRETLVRRLERHGM